MPAAAAQPPAKPSPFACLAVAFVILIKMAGTALGGALYGLLLGILIRAVTSRQEFDPGLFAATLGICCGLSGLYLATAVGLRGWKRLGLGSACGLAVAAASLLLRWSSPIPDVVTGSMAWFTAAWTAAMVLSIAYHLVRREKPAAIPKGEADA